MDKHLVIVGGGLAGLSAGCYARASGFRTTIVEHNLELGGVCTAWPRGRYLIDGCIHWLTGGPFMRVYEELGIVPKVPLRTLETWATWRDAKTGAIVTISRDLDALARDLLAIGPDDGSEIARLMDAASHFAHMSPPGLDRAQELTTVGEQLHALWQMRDSVGALVHFRKPVEEWTRERLRSDVLRRFFTRLVPEGAPALVLLMVLGYLKNGYLSRPVGGTARFRDALIGSYRQLGGDAMLHATVDEILIDGGRARGVRLGDGTIVEGDAVVSTSSTPETVLRLLGGRYAAEETRHRMHDWKMFDPIVLASFGVASPLTDVPSLLLVDGLAPFVIGGAENEHLYLRVCNDDPCFAPSGHAVVQAMLSTDYEWWATRGARYSVSKDEVAEAALAQIEHAIPGIHEFVRMTDVATPLTFWNMARSWRGAFEGWMPSSQAFFGHIKKTLPKLDRFYMAGQWVEPGGGVPVACMSGRQAVQILCADEGIPFADDPSRAIPVAAAKAAPRTDGGVMLAR